MSKKTENTPKNIKYSEKAFERFGAEGLTVSAISRKLGVSYNSITYQFAQHPEYKAAFERGKASADAQAKPKSEKISSEKAEKTKAEIEAKILQAIEDGYDNVLNISHFLGESGAKVHSCLMELVAKKKVERIEKDDLVFYRLPVEEETFEPEIPADPEEMILNAIGAAYKTSRHICQDTGLDINTVIEILEDHCESGGKLTRKFTGGVNVYYLSENEPAGQLYNSGNGEFLVREIEETEIPKPKAQKEVRATKREIEPLPPVEIKTDPVQIHAAPGVILSGDSESVAPISEVIETQQNNVETATAPSVEDVEVDPRFAHLFEVAEEKYPRSAAGIRAKKEELLKKLNSEKPLFEPPQHHISETSRLSRIPEVKPEPAASAVEQQPEDEEIVSAPESPKRNAKAVAVGSSRLFLGFEGNIFDMDRRGRAFLNKVIDLAQKFEAEGE